MKRIAISQPYLFPYVGYYQLFNCADEFIFLDDANFIKGGFVNRNFIICNKKITRFNIPIHKKSSNRPINDHYYFINKTQFKNLILEGYSKSKNFSVIYDLISNIIEIDDQNVSLINIRSIEMVYKFLGFNKTFYLSSKILPRGKYKKEDWIIEICKKLNSTNYINSEGGKDLYELDYFKSNGIKLEFLKPNFLEYHQGITSFTKGLSIIDILMNSDINKVKEMIFQYKIE
tara:strand:+ start:188 stop:880 length:693 start_codon:yes stop_codon:yes gene_type:complete